VATGRAVQTAVAACPECDENITLKGKVEWGQQVNCPHCGTELEVINTNPLELDWIFDDYDDDYDDDDDDDDDY